jgi:hypothetical protein
MDSIDALKVKRNEQAIWRVIDGEAVLLVPEEAELHALKGCGSRVWELLGEESSISEIVQRICTEYEVEPRRARKDITEFVYQLNALKLVELIPATEEAIR